jgi:hypothetical protein
MRHFQAVQECKHVLAQQSLEDLKTYVRNLEATLNLNFEERKKVDATKAFIQRQVLLTCPSNQMIVDCQLTLKLKTFLEEREVASILVDMWA